jgi:hypothetical protein
MHALAASNPESLLRLADFSFSEVDVPNSLTGLLSGSTRSFFRECMCGFPQ